MWSTEGGKGEKERNDGERGEKERNGGGSEEMK